MRLKVKKIKPAAEKKVKKYDAADLATKALRKLWRNSPMRVHFLNLACVDSSVHAYKRKFRCALCNGLFLAQQIDVDHIQCLGKNSSIQQKFEHFLYGHEHFKNKKYEPTDEFSGLMFEQYYQVLCKDCHKLKTKEEKAKNSKTKKGKK